MPLFILLFLILYGGLNGYIYFTVVSGLGRQSWILATGLILLVVSPIILRLSEGRVPGKVSVVIAWVGYNWMGVGLLFACIALVFDGAQLFTDRLTDGGALLGILVLTVVASLYGFVESRRIRIRCLTVQSPKLEYEGSKPFRLVQISDLHLGYGTLPGQVRRVADQLKKLKPDLLVSTGDLFDTDLENLGYFVEQLVSVTPPSGKVAITGNHEVYAGLGKALELTKNAGFQVLRSASRKVGENIYVAGVDDPEALAGRTAESAESEALAGIPAAAFTILLKHRPRISQAQVTKFDLQLSGHTHGGQIVPFILFTWLQYRVPHGLTKIAESTYLYLSRGTGSWGPQMRVFAPPEITVFDLSFASEVKVKLK